MLTMAPPIADRTTGIPLAVGELLMLQGFASSRGFAMTIDLHQAYDEVVTLSDPETALHWTLWRTRDGIAMQSRPDRETWFASMPDLLASFGDDAPELTDIAPAGGFPAAFATV